MSSVLSVPRTRLVALVAAAVVAGGVVGVAVSQLGVATATPTRAGVPSPGSHGPSLLGGPGGRLLHGEATIATAAGKTAVVRMQNGAITAVGGDSVTVKSSDGFTATYAVDKTTRISLNGVDGALTALKKGDTVRVFGMVDGTTVHAKAVLDGLGDRAGMLERWRHHMHRGGPPASGSA